MLVELSACLSLGEVEQLFQDGAVGRQLPGLDTSLSVVWVEGNLVRGKEVATQVGRRSCMAVTW